jgi:predicted SnoaL-like aldol condensation-catalyzing enzyme
MGPKLYNAVRLYVDGVRDGHLGAALDKYVAEDLVQHTPGVAPGRAGLGELFESLVGHHTRRMIRPMRGFEDASKVFLHTYHSYGFREVERVSIDIFDTDDDHQLVEHWHVSTPMCSQSRSGRSQIDGPTCVADLARTEANKELVSFYVKDVLVGGDRSRILDYVSPETFHQHNPDISDSVDGFLDHLDERAAAGIPTRYCAIDQLVGCGDFVATVGRTAAEHHDTIANTVADLFRLEGGRIVEHWDAIE